MGVGGGDNWLEIVGSLELASEELMRTGLGSVAVDLEKGGG